MLIKISVIDKTRILVTSRVAFFTIFITAKNPMDAKSKSIIGLWVIPSGSIVNIGNTKQCTRHIVALEIPKKSQLKVVFVFILCILA